MSYRIFGGLFLVSATAILWGFNNFTPEFDLSEAVRSLSAITITYILFKVFLRFIIDRRIKEAKAKYLFRRLNNSALYIVSVFWLLTIWVENTETLLLSYGLLSAAVAFALQDLFKDLIGGFVLLGNGNYRVGDRIEVDGVAGDVVKISLLYTTILEIKNWVNGDQPTGRLTIVPNGRVARAIVHNYTKDHEFIWDEITIPITYESNWQSVIKSIKKILNEKQAHLTEKAEKQMELLSKHYYIENHVSEPNVFIKLTDNWIELHIRYITDTANRRKMQSAISEEILKEIQKSKDINIASETIKLLK
jgi:small-conductance mechanosensitive channel